MKGYQIYYDTEELNLYLLSYFRLALELDSVGIFNALYIATCANFDVSAANYICNCTSKIDIVSLDRLTLQVDLVVLINYGFCNNIELCAADFTNTYCAKLNAYFFGVKKTAYITGSAEFCVFTAYVIFNTAGTAYKKIQRFYTTADIACT